MTLCKPSFLNYSRPSNLLSSRSLDTHSVLSATENVIRSIIGLKLGKIGKRLKKNYNASFTYAEELVQLIADRCKEVDTGARNIDHILTRTLLPDLSAELLSRLPAVSASSRCMSAPPPNRVSYTTLGSSTSIDAARSLLNDGIVKQQFCLGGDNSFDRTCYTPAVPSTGA